MKQIIFKITNKFLKFLWANQVERLGIRKALNRFLNKEIVYNYVSIERYN